MKILKRSLLTIILAAFAVNGMSQNVLDGVYVRDNYKTRKVIPYTPLREADVMWSRRIWRIVDLREKINHPFFFPVQPINNRLALFDVIKKALNEGKLTAYNNPVVDEEFKTPMTKSELEALFFKSDTLERENIDNPGVMEQVITKTELGPKDIEQFLIKEDWFFDKQKSVLDVRIIGICPLSRDYSQSGEFRGYKRLFWLYFPECRSVFANAEVFNRQNMSERRTFEDIFWKRMFGSYIVKEENVYDRSIVEYKQGLDALLESDRMKADIFNWEHDLWHF
jgi:gliding motility associated protien GldN